MRLLTSLSGSYSQFKHRTQRELSDEFWARPVLQPVEGVSAEGWDSGYERIDGRPGSGA
jgi:hypothetical protein